MKSDEKVIAIASRIEIDENSGKLFIVFEVVDEHSKQNIKKHWVDDIEFKLINKSLVQNND